MIAGVSWTWWVGFHAVVAGALLADSLMPGHRRASRHAQAFVWLGTAGLALAAAGFACWIAVTMGRQTALEFVAGYTIETSLSIDNLFVFLVLFEGFRISAQRQHTALQWGVWGAFVLRAAFIAVGVTLLQRFAWVTWIFGLILLYAAWRLVRGGSARAAIPEWIVRLQPAKGSLLPVIVAVHLWRIRRTSRRFWGCARSILDWRRCLSALSTCTTGWARCWPLRRSRCSRRDGSMCR
jgi:tellurite resistance protein TerC